MARSRKLCAKVYLDSVDWCETLWRAAFGFKDLTFPALLITPT